MNLAPMWLDIIVAENGQLVAEDLWNGFDAGALETVSEYLQENGTTLYDLMEFPKDSVVTLRSGQTLTIEENTGSTERYLGRNDGRKK